MEIVPVEAVVGIFEVKRTLTQETLLGTLGALGTEQEKSALQHLRDICAVEKLKKWRSEHAIDFGMLDIILSLNGWMVCLSTVEEGEKTPWILMCRQKGYKYTDYLNYATPKFSPTKVIGMALGFIVGYVTLTCGRRIDQNNYFFNQCLL